MQTYFGFRFGPNQSCTNGHHSTIATMYRPNKAYLPNRCFRGSRVFFFDLSRAGNITVRPLGRSPTFFFCKNLVKKYSEKCQWQTNLQMVEWWISIISPAYWAFPKMQARTTELREGASWGERRRIPFLPTRPLLANPLPTSPQFFVHPSSFARPLACSLVWSLRLEKKRKVYFSSLGSFMSIRFVMFCKTHWILYTSYIRKYGRISKFNYRWNTDPWRMRALRNLQ